MLKTFTSYKSFKNLYLVYKNVCLKFLRPILKKLENANFTKFYLKFFCTCFHVNLHVAYVIPIFEPTLHVNFVSWSRNVRAVVSALQVVQVLVE